MGGEKATAPHPQWDGHHRPEGAQRLFAEPGSRDWCDPVARPGCHRQDKQQALTVQQAEGTKKQGAAAKTCTDHSYAGQRVQAGTLVG
jgi:hypothetical protein